MLLENRRHNLYNNINLLFEKTTGWSSACLDSTIDYYCNNLEKNKHNKI